MVNRRIAITISVLAAATLLLAGAVAVPTVMAITNLRIKMAEANQMINQKYQLRRHSRTALEALQRAKEQINTLSSVAVIEGQELEFVSALEQAAESAGIKQDLTLETVNQRDVSPWEKEIPMKIRAAGDYRDLLVYLYKVQKLPVYITMTSVEIAAPAQRRSAADGLVEANFSATVRWLAKDQPVFRQIEIEPLQAEE